MRLDAQLKRAIARGIAAGVRYTTTMNPKATVEQMIAAGAKVGLNAKTVKKQFAQARKEDAEVERITAGMTDEEITEAIVRCVRRS